jgi:uncharacterized protein YciI
MPTFAVRTVHRSGWDPQRPMREQDAWEDHAAFMNGLAADGFVVLGGPLGPGGQHNGGHGALLIIQAPDEQEVRTRLNADPWAARDILVIESVDPWAILLDTRHDH